MKRHVILMLVITTALCGCSGEKSKSLLHPLAAPRAKAATAQPVPDQPSTPTPAKAATAQPLADEPSSGADAEKSDLGDYVSFPAFGIKIRQPKGFEKADRFDGFGEPETQSSIMAVGIPAPDSQISAGLTKELMKARGWALHSRDAVNVNGLAGILVHFEQPAGDEMFLKWCFVFGDDQKTTMVTATFPKAHEQALSAPLKAAVLSLRPDRAVPPDPGADLPFTLAATQKLKLSPGITRTLAGTRGNEASRRFLA
jgi:hypothetical protein